MKFGLKLHTSNYLLYRDAIDAIAAGSADYLELTYLSSELTDLELLREANIPVVLHSAHAGHGVNYSGDKVEKNLRELHSVISAADLLDAKHIIVHPDRGNIENFVRVFSMVTDSRLIVENMPKAAKAGGDCVGFHYGELKYLMDMCSCGLCLDFGHAFKAANSIGEDFISFCEQLIALGPTMFHIAQGGRATEQDEHLELYQGDIDLPYVKGLIDSVDREFFVTLEVPFYDGINNALRSIEYFKEL